MTEEVTKAGASLPALATAKEEFMAEAGSAREYPARFEIRLGNKHLSDDSDPENPKVHPDFKKLFLYGNEMTDESDTGFVNYKREVDFKTTSFLVLKRRSIIEGKYENGKFVSFSEEVDNGSPFVITDVNGEKIYEGGFNLEAFKDLGVTLRTVLWVVPVVNGKISKQLYRWVIKGQDRDSFNGVMKEINAAQKTGTFLTLKIEEVTSYKAKNGNMYPTMWFNVGPEVPCDEDFVLVWTSFKNNWDKIKTSDSYFFRRRNVAKDEVEVIAPTKPTAKSQLMKTKSEVAKETAGKQAAEVANTPTDLPWETMGEDK